MQTHNLIQGTDAWHAYRREHDNASDAAAMMGQSSYKTRDELIAELSTGITPEVNAATQRLFDSGHRFEALARPLAEAIIGQDLYPVTGSLEGSRLSASFDGLTMLEDVAFEHKRLNSRLRAAFANIQEAVQDGVLVDGMHPTHCAAQLLPLEYQTQMEQQCAVSGCEKVLFMASEWAEDDTLIEELHCWYTPNPELRAQILAGWEQLHKDVAAYTPPAAHATPIVGRAPEHLPALRIEVSGAVTASNLAEFKATAMAAIAGVNRELATDTDFADAEASVKWCSEVESRLDAAKQHALSQTVDIEALFRTMDDIAAEARRVRLELDKLVKQRKEQLRGEIVAGGVTALRTHIASLNQSLGRDYMPAIPADFGAAVKGKRSLDSMHGAVNDELARAKIAANEVATRIQTNLKALHNTPEINLMLFHDLGTVVLKAPDDFAMLVHGRMIQHLAEKQRQIDVQRERIRAEEQAKAQREANEKAARAIEEVAATARKAAQEQARIDADAAQAVSDLDAANAKCLLQTAPAAQAPDPAIAPVRTLLRTVAGIGIYESMRPAVQEQADDGERVNLSAINEHLHPIKLDAAGLALLGFEPVEMVKASKLYRGSDLARIRAALAKHLAQLGIREACTQ